MPSWSEETPLSSEQNIPTRAVVCIFWAIWLGLLTAIAVWVGRIPKRSAATRSVLSWNKFGLAIGFGLFFYAFSFIRSILDAAEVNVSFAYYLVEALFDCTDGLADIWLLGTIYALKLECLVRSDSADRPLKHRILLLHYLICVALFVLLMIATGLEITYTVQWVTSTSPATNEDYYGAFYASNIVTITYDALFVMAALELVIGSIWALVRSRGRGQPLKADFLFISTVAVPTLARGLLHLSYNATYREVKESSNTYPTLGSYLAEDILGGFCNIIIYGTVVYVAVRLEEIKSGAWVGHLDPAHGPLTSYDGETEMHHEPYVDMYRRGPIMDSGKDTPYVEESNLTAEIHAESIPIPEVHG